jgi:hypothetical protein
MKVSQDMMIESTLQMRSDKMILRYALHKSFTIYMTEANGIEAW